MTNLRIEHVEKIITSFIIWYPSHIIRSILFSFCWGGGRGGVVYTRLVLLFLKVHSVQLFNNFNTCSCCISCSACAMVEGVMFLDWFSRAPMADPLGGAGPRGCGTGNPG